MPLGIKHVVGEETHHLVNDETGQRSEFVPHDQAVLLNTQGYIIAAANAYAKPMMCKLLRPCSFKHVGADNKEHKCDAWTNHSKQYCGRHLDMMKRRASRDTKIRKLMTDLKVPNVEAQKVLDDLNKFAETLASNTGQV